MGMTLPCFGNYIKTVSLNSQQSRPCCLSVATYFRKSLKLFFLGIDRVTTLEVFNVLIFFFIQTLAIPYEVDQRLCSTILHTKAPLYVVTFLLNKDIMSTTRISIQDTSKILSDSKQTIVDHTDACLMRDTNLRYVPLGYP